MAALVVGTTPTEIPGAQGAIVAIQNRSGGDIELLETASGVVGDGIVIADGQTYEPPRPFPGPRWLIASVGGADVRLHGV